MRRAGPEEEDALLGLFDEAVAWMVARGQERQWGSTPPSQDEAWRARVGKLLREAETYLLARGGKTLGALALGDAPPYVEASSEPELYLLLVLTARTHAGQGLGARLLAFAHDLARERGLGAMRVDCWAEAPGLIGWYERQGFRRCGEFELGGWRGAVLRRDLGS